MMKLNLVVLTACSTLGVAGLASNALARPKPRRNLPCASAPAMPVPAASQAGSAMPVPSAESNGVAFMVNRPGQVPDPMDAERVRFATVTTGIAPFLPGPHLSVTTIAHQAGEPANSSVGAAASHVASLAGILLESGQLVRASEIRTLKLMSFDANVLHFAVTGTGPNLGRDTWYCASEPIELEGAKKIHAYCTATMPKDNAAWPACSVEVKMSQRKWAVSQAKVDQIAFGKVVMQYRFIDASRNYSEWFTPKRATIDQATPNDEPWQHFTNGNAFTVELCPIPSGRK